MKSETADLFWKAYAKLEPNLKRSAKKAYAMWRENPFHPSLHFKCVNSKGNVWAVRISKGYRALGVMDNDTVTWFWVGSHDNYEKFFG